MSAEFNNSTPEQNASAVFGEVVIRNGKPYFRDEKDEMHELEPMDGVENNVSSSGLAEYEVTIKMSGTDYPYNILNFGNHAPHITPQVHLPPEPPNARSFSYVDQTVEPYDMQNETLQTHTHENEVAIVPKIVVPVEREVIKKRSSNKAVVIGSAVVAAIFFTGLAANGVDAGKNSGDICASNGLASLFSDPLCGGRHLLTDAFHIPLPESK